jgi:transcriptional regulator with XRE-family HTH domain
MALILADDDEEEAPRAAARASRGRRPPEGKESLEGELLPPERRTFTRFESIERVLEVVPKLMIAARRDLGITQEALADRLGIDSTYPSLIERGLRRPSLRMYLTIACGLNKDPVQFLQAAIDCAAHPDELITAEASSTPTRLLLEGRHEVEIATHITDDSVPIPLVEHAPVQMPKLDPVPVEDIMRDLAPGMGVSIPRWVARRIERVRNLLRTHYGMRFHVEEHGEGITIRRMDAG